MEVHECDAPELEEVAELAMHLLEDKDLISDILRNQVPSEEYYGLLRAHLRKEHPLARDCVLEHIAELEEFFDLCILIGFSFGINKMITLQSKVKLLGEIIGRLGRFSDPEKVKAIKEWGPIRNLKGLQEFLGTCNYSRALMGPKYARAADGLRR